MSQRYIYNDQGEITNVEPVVNQPDFRAYPEETLETERGPVVVALCAELVCGRWEYFVAFPRTGDTAPLDTVPIDMTVG